MCTFGFGISSIFFHFQPGLEYNSTTQEYTGTPTMSACKPKPRKGKKRKHDGDPVELDEDENEVLETEEQVEKGPEVLPTEPKDLSLATHAMSIMICGLTKRYKNIVGFHLTDASFDGKECAEFIREAILKLDKIGYKVKAVVMDMSTLNTNV